MKRYRIGAWPGVFDKFKRLFKTDAREFFDWRICYDNDWNIILDKKKLLRYFTIKYVFQRQRITLHKFILQTFGVRALIFYKQITL